MYNIKRKPLPNIRIRTKHPAVRLPSGQGRTSSTVRISCPDTLGPKIN